MRALRAVLPPLVALALVLALWESLARGLSVPLYLLPPPSAVARAASNELSSLLAAAWVTARAALYGLR